MKYVVAYRKEKYRDQHVISFDFIPVDDVFEKEIVFKNKEEKIVDIAIHIIDDGLFHNRLFVDLNVV